MDNEGDTEWILVLVNTILYLKYSRLILDCFEYYHASESHSYQSVDLLTSYWVDYFPVNVK